MISDTDALLTLEESLLLYTLPKFIPSHGVIVEIGSFKGGSGILLAKGSKIAKKGKVYCIDPFSNMKFSWCYSKNVFAMFLSNIKKHNISDYIIPFVGTSTKASVGWSKPISLLWIDGNHTYKYVKLDFLLWEKYLVKGGIIALHDTKDSVNKLKFLNKCIKKFEGPEKVVKEYLIGSKRFKILEGIDSITYAVKIMDSGYAELLKNKAALLSIYFIQFRTKLYLNLDRFLGKIGIYLKANHLKLYLFLTKFKK